MKIIQSIALLLVMPLFILGGSTIAENLPEGNFGIALIGLGMLIMSGVLLVFVIVSEKVIELLKDDHMGSFRQKMHRKIYDKLIYNGYDINVAYNIASRITHWS